MGEILVSFLDANDIRVIVPQSQDCLDIQVHGRSTGDVVENDRQFDLSGHPTEEAVKPLLAWPDVIGHDEQQGVRPIILSIAAKMDRLLQIVGSGTGYERHPAADHFGGIGNNSLTFRKRQGAGLARRARYRKAVGAAGDLPIDQVGQGLFIQVAITKRRNQGDNRTS